CMAVGPLALMLALRAPARPPRRAALDFALLGLILGLAFWENLLTLVFFPPVAAVLLARGVHRRLLPAALAGIPAFILGSLPHWLYRLPHHTPAPPAGERIHLADLGAHVAGFAKAAWPMLTGVPVALRGTLAGGVTTAPLELRITPLGALLIAAVSALYVAALLDGLR